MVYLNKDIEILLKPVCTKIEAEFLESNATFPVITISEIINKAGKVVEGVEYTSDITIQLDIWDNSNTRTGCETMAKQVDTIMSTNGFLRVNSRGFKDPSGLQRKMLQYRIEVFNK